jgi:hypothetical protein
MTADLLEMIAPSADPRCGLLVQLEGNPCSCGEDTTVIGPGTETHAGRLDCYGCGKFRLWLPRDIYNFVTACVTAAGMPTKPVVYRDRNITIGDKTVTAPEKGFQSKPNTGALFRNERKINDNDRDYSGEININGTEYWLSGWAKQSQKTGRKYLSVTVKAKQESAKPTAASFDDEIPL